MAKHSTAYAASDVVGEVPKWIRKAAGSLTPATQTADKGTSQSVRDWFDGSGPDLIYINGKTMRSILEENGINYRRGSGFASDRERQEVLEQFWQKFLFEKMGLTDAAQIQKMTDYFNSYLHQGAVLNFAQTETYQYANSNGMTIVTADDDRRIDISVMPGKIHLVERVRVKETVDKETEERKNARMDVELESRLISMVMAK